MIARAIRPAADVNVSVIVPAYNAAGTIAETLTSLLAQTHARWEVTVVDDGSTDGTGRIVRQFMKRDARVRIVRQRNGGESAARNTGITNARHNWLLFLDADDWISPVHLERMTDAVASDQTLDAVHCQYARVAADGTEVVEQYEPPIGDLFPTLARRSAFPVHACLVRAELVREVGMFDTSLRTSPDWDLWQRVARAGAKFGAVREVLAFYRMTSHGASLDAHQLFKDGIRVLKQGQTADPRVPRPHPDHAQGAADERLETQEFYLLCWCAGLLLGTGLDARPLLKTAGEDRFPELYPDAVAQCVFESVPLPTCQPPRGWEQLWPAVRGRVSDFLTALEAQSKAPDLARLAMSRLKRLILQSSPTWDLFVEEVHALTAPLHADRANWQRLAEERELLVAKQREMVEQLAQSRTTLEQALARARDERREVEQLLNGERLGRVLVERQVRALHQDLQETDGELRKCDEELHEKAEVIGRLHDDLGLSESAQRQLEETARLEQEAAHRATRQVAHLKETIDWTRSEIDSAFQHAEDARQKQAATLQQLAAVESAASEKDRRHAVEVARLRSSPEWRVGDTLWNGAGLSRVGRPAARAFRRLQDRRTRWGLVRGNGMHPRETKRPRAVVAACWSFPIPSQTFVYQEMLSLEWAGLDYQVFCCETNSKDGLPEAFEALWSKRVVLKSDLSQNQADLEHFRRTCPERVEAILARLGESTGLTRDALLQESIVMMGFTFARHVELSKADYLHTYFFYDQSFMALMAAWLLEIPRGVTTYADHMLNDYAFKCVPLHLELADIIVATSQRIKSELSALSGGRYDDKILVKPNGIDTARFPYIAAADRLASDQQPELISVSRIEPKKGLIYLVEALGILKERGIAARLNIVGGVDHHTPTSADCYRELIERIAELGLSDRIVLHGTMKQSAFLPLLARSRLFIAPYVEVASGDKDGIPTALLEAMSTGLPVIATDAGSIAEAATDGIEALSVPQRDAARLADAIERLLGDENLYRRMAVAARRRVVAEFDAHVTERDLHERIRSCLSRSHGSAIQEMQR